VPGELYALPKPILEQVRAREQRLDDRQVPREVVALRDDQSAFAEVFDDLAIRALPLLLRHLALASIECIAVPLPYPFAKRDHV